MEMNKLNNISTINERINSINKKLPKLYRRNNISEKDTLSKYNLVEKGKLSQAELEKISSKNLLEIRLLNIEIHKLEKEKEILELIVKRFEMRTKQIKEEISLKTYFDEIPNLTYLIKKKQLEKELLYYEDTLRYIDSYNMAKKYDNTIESVNIGTSITELMAQYELLQKEFKVFEKEEAIKSVNRDFRRHKIDQVTTDHKLKEIEKKYKYDDSSESKHKIK